MAIDLEAIRAKLAAMQNKGNEGGGGGRKGAFDFWNAPGPGEYVLRPMPWKEALDGCPILERHFYYIGDQPRVLCPFQFGEEDPVNEFRRKLFATKDPRDKEYAKKLFPRVNGYILVIDRADPTNTVKVLSLNKTNHEKLLLAFTKAKIGDWMDPDDGFDLEVTVKQVLGKKYADTTMEVGRDKGPIFDDPAKVKELLDRRPAIAELDKVFRRPDAEGLKAMVNKLLAEPLKAKEGDTEHTEEADKGTVREAAAPVDELEQLKAEVAKEKTKSSPEASDVKKAVKRKTLNEAFEDLEK